MGGTTEFGVSIRGQQGFLSEYFLRIADCLCHLSTNVSKLTEVGDFEIQMFNLVMKFNSSKKVQINHVCPNFGNAMLAVAFLGGRTKQIIKMRNVDFLKEVLMSDAEYWVVAQEVTAQEYGRSVRRKDHIMFIAIPKGIKRGLKYEEVTLQELEKLKGSYCEQNIYINTDYPPFQQYVSFYDIYRGFPVTHKIRQFMLDALSLGSDEIWEYKKLIQVPDAVEVSA